MAVAKEILHIQKLVDENNPNGAFTMVQRNRACTKIITEELFQKLNNLAPLKQRNFNSEELIVVESQKEGIHKGLELIRNSVKTNHYNPLARQSDPERLAETALEREQVYFFLQTGDYNTAMEHTRTKIRGKFGRIFRERFEYCESEIQRWSVNTERGIWNASLHQAKKENIPKTWKHKEMRRIYTRITTRVSSNLKFTPNANSVIERLESAEILPQQLAFLTPDELDPESARILRERQHYELHYNDKNWETQADGMYACPKCKCKKTDYVERQTRSADEPMTVFLTCLRPSCGKRWRM
uniref:TFIIS-type domain-containing protein n=1 Tax=viral metagenome TaxID=1070528 RepID=A0A6C0KEG2_9ZZZZ